MALLTAFAGCRPAPRTAGEMPHDAYVWQRAWTPAVRAALENGAPSSRSFVVLTAEISVRETAPQITRIPLDHGALLSTKRPIGLAIRVRPFAGPFKSDDAASRAIRDLALERLAEARAHGVEPAELQIDFDCAEAKLAGYRVWLRALREAVHPLPVCPTVLPSWLPHREFAGLARDSGRFVLQVHAVSPPRTRADARMLTDPVRAAEWVERAGRLGVPFRVALPTYAYLVAFDAEGKFHGISAEGPSSQWPPDAEVVRWEADPAEIAALVATWTRDRPAALSGLIWYRLPVATDALNWRWATLAAVMPGRAPRRALRLEATSAQPSEIVAINDGERDEPLPPFVEARWTGAPLIGADALAGYELEAAAGPGAPLIFRRKAAAALSRLSPGSRRPIGWIRCATLTDIRLSMVDAPPPPAPRDAAPSAAER